MGTATAILDDVADRLDAAAAMLDRLTVRTM
jgi:hypothetical protein